MSLNKKILSNFLDKGGVINEDLYNTRYQDIRKICLKVPSAIKIINDSNYLAIVVTNQPSIAKGFVREKKVQDDLDI